VARYCEQIVKHILFRYREKSSQDTEVFNLDVKIIHKLANNIINIFDNPLHNTEQELEFFLNICDSKSNATIETVLKKIETLHGASPSNSHNSTSVTDNSNNVIVNVNIPPQVKTYQSAFYKQTFLQKILQEQLFNKLPEVYKNVVAKKVILDRIHKFILDTNSDVPENRTLKSVTKRLTLKKTDHPEKSDCYCGYACTFVKDIENLLLEDGFTRYSCRKSGEVSGFHLKIVK
jgi:hypothetical protein